MIRLVSSVSQVLLHPAVLWRDDDSVDQVLRATGRMIEISHRHPNQILLVTPFEAVMREALRDLPIHEIPSFSRSNP